AGGSRWPQLEQLRKVLVYQLLDMRHREDARTRVPFDRLSNELADHDGLPGAGRHRHDRVAFLLAEVVVQRRKGILLVRPKIDHRSEGTAVTLGSIHLASKMPSAVRGFEVGAENHASVHVATIRRRLGVRLRGISNLVANVAARHLRDKVRPRKARDGRSG